MLSLQMIVCVFSVIFTDGLNVEMFINMLKLQMAIIYLL